MDTIFKDLNPVLQMLILMTVFSLLPFVFSCMTSFLRFVVVFSILKQALGTQQVPPSIVMIGLSIILTFFIENIIYFILHNTVINKKTTPMRITPQRNRQFEII